MNEVARMNDPVAKAGAAGQPDFLTAALPTAAEMERAFLSRDAAYDGIFFTGVRTTGIFCRPSCPARKPLPANIEYFATVREALFAGDRPCRRCEPTCAPGGAPGGV
jgi:AraC family transcriptional regulator of adaptative response/methylated-DNA-[protein]-cysteine methyltransferase